jgi:hypothetical protein
MVTEKKTPETKMDDKKVMVEVVPLLLRKTCV